VLANHVALLRPRTAGFYAFTPKAMVCRQLSLTRGITAFQIAFAVSIEETIVAVTEHLKERGLVRPGMPIVIVSDILSNHFGANSILLHHA
jgi:pyruvate kinase